MPENIIERAWDVFEKHQRGRGVSVDEVSFMGGFMSCFGVLTGRIPVGLPDDTPLLKLFELVQRNLDDARNKVIMAQDNERKNGG